MSLVKESNDLDGQSTVETSPESSTRFPILIVGNLLSKSNGIRSVCEDLSKQLEATGWPVIKTSTKLGKLSRITDMVSTVWRQRRRFEVAQVNVYSGPAFVWAEAVCWSLRRLDKPFVLTLHGGNLPEFAKRWPGRVRRLLHGARAVTTPSDYLYERMRSYCERLQKLPNALEIGRYAFRHRSNPRPHLIWLRSFHQIYNPTLAPMVLSKISDAFPESTLTMIGPDKNDGSLDETRAVIEQLGLTKRVQIVGKVPKEEVPRWLNDGDILLNTTNFDNTPVSLLEAMACGLCVISTNVGGIPYLIQDGDNGLLTPPNDAESMAQAVRRCLTEPSLASHLSRYSRSSVEQFDWSVVLPQWNRLFHRIRKEY